MGEAKRSRTICEFKKIPNTNFVVWGIDNILTSMLYYRNSNDLENIIERISLIEHVSNVHTGIPWSRLSTDVKISLLEWKIISSLNHNARKRNHEIAKELEVSPKTIKRKLDRLVRNKVLFFTVDVDLSKSKDHIIYVLSVELETGVKRKKIHNEIKNKFCTIWATVGPVQPAIVFFMYARSLSEIGNVVEEVKRIAGLKTVNISIYTSYHKFPEWYDKQIEKTIKNYTNS
jgi:DNA-binding Lrp family transcriptional regulator